MRQEEFKNLKTCEKLQPNYPEFSQTCFDIKSINQREGLVEINQRDFFSPTKWYRYENLSRVKFVKIES